jgi:hypothetical protein
MIKNAIFTYSVEKHLFRQKYGVILFPLRVNLNLNPLLNMSHEIVVYLCHEILGQFSVCFFHLIYISVCVIYFLSFVSILDLPDLPLIRILQFISLDKLLNSDNRTCKRLNELIKYTTISWLIFNRGIVKYC